MVDSGTNLGDQEKIGKNKTPIRVILFLVFLFILGIRIFYSFQAEGFSDDDSYFILRQVESIRESGFPVYEDSLSFGGRSNIFSPVYHYILAFFSFFMPVWGVGKIIPQIFAASSVFFVYLVSREVSGSRRISLFIAAASSFVPVFFMTTLNTVSPYALVFPLIFFMLFCFLKIGEPRTKKKNMTYAYVFIIGSVFFSLFHPSFFVFIVGIGTYLVLAWLDKIKIYSGEVETVIFAAILSVWANLIIYKKALIRDGLMIIWRNLPVQVLNDYFSQISFGMLIYYVGIIPLFFGVYVVYKTILKERSKKLYVLFGFALSVGLILVLKIFPVKEGLSLIGLLLVVFFGVFIKWFVRYISLTRFSGFKSVILGIIVSLFIVFSIVPSLSLASETIDKSSGQNEIEALKWVKENTPESSVVFAPFEYGHMVSFVSERRNIADSNFLMINDGNTRLDDIKTMYSTKIETKALSVLQNYEASFVLVNRKILDLFKTDSASYFDGDCFDKVYSGGFDVYMVKCEVGDS